MAISQEKLKYRGPYRQYDPRGYAVLYSLGDVVLYDGKQYVATQNNITSIPSNINNNWRLLSGDVEGYHYSDDKPLNANVGDRWVDRVSGRMYTYIEDKNGFHWVEF